MTDAVKPLASDYRGMEYPLEQLPALWLKLADELKDNAKEVENDDPALARTFSHRAISIIACAEQLTWALTNRRTPPAGWKPIETAPDDLTIIVASISINGQVNWVSDGIRGKGVMRLLWHTVYGTHVPSPTHWIGLPNDWMPLPAAPENDDEQT